jgi:hypothetical protein
MATTAVVGAIAGLASGILLGIVQAKMKEEIAEALENMPKPNADPRAAPDYFADPKTARAIRLIDLLAKNLKPFGQELDAHHQDVVGGTNTEIALLAVSSLPDPERVAFLSGLQDQLQAYARDLGIVFDNLNAAKDVSSKAMDAARDVQDLIKLLDTGLVSQWLYDQGFTVIEISRLGQNLASYAAYVRIAFEDVDALHGKVKDMREDVAKPSSQVSKLSWSIILARAVEEQKKKSPQQ